MPKVVFVGFDFTNGTELWVTDGTAAGTYLLRDIWLGSGTGLPAVPDVVGLGNGSALFEAQTSVVIDGHITTSAATAYGAELWVTNGTSGTPKASYQPNNHGHGAYFTGTSMVKDIAPVLGMGSYPHNITALGNGKALFSAYAIGG